MSAPGRGGMRSEPSHPARRLQRPVRRMLDRAGIEPVERRRRDRRPSRPRSRPRAGRRTRARSSSRSASSTASRKLPTRRNASPASCSMRSSARSVSAISRRAESAPSVDASPIVRRCRTAQREAAVPAARAGRDLAGLVQPHAHPALRERERAGAAGDAAADHGHLGASLEARRAAARAAARQANMKLSSRAAILCRGHHLPVPPLGLCDHAQQLELGDRRRDTRRVEAGARTISSTDAGASAMTTRTRSSRGIQDCRRRDGGGRARSPPERRRRR